MKIDSIEYDASTETLFVNATVIESKPIESVNATIEIPHCSLCEHYETVNGFMFCKRLKRQITARKKACKYYERHE